MILVVLFVLVEREVLVDVLHIRRRLIGRAVAFGRVLVVSRVALRHVDTLVASQNGSFYPVEVGTSVVMVVIVGRVGLNTVEDFGSHLALNVVEELLISTIVPLFFIVETIETDILQQPGSSRSIEGIGRRCLCGHLTPLRRGVASVVVDGHAALIEFLPVTQNILAHLAEVDVQFATMLRSCAVAAAVDERIKHPELHVFDVGCLEIVRIELAHHASPGLSRIHQFSFRIQVGVQIVRSTLVRIESQVQNGQRISGTAIAVLVAVGVQFVHVNLAHVPVRELIEVALDVAWRQ